MSIPDRHSTGSERPARDRQILRQKKKNRIGLRIAAMHPVEMVATYWKLKEIRS